MVVAMRRDPSTGRWGRGGSTAQGEATRKRIYKAIVDHIDDMGIAPTAREIQAVAGVSSTSVVAQHLKVLSDNGKIIWYPGMARGIALPKERT